MFRLNEMKENIIYIIQYWIYMCMYTINIRTLKIHFDMLCPLNKAKVIFKVSLLSNAKWDTFNPSKVFISFVELSVLYYLRYM